MFTASPILLCGDLIIFVGLDPSVETSFHSISSISNAIVDAGQIQGCPPGNLCVQLPQGEWFLGFQRNPRQKIHARHSKMQT